MIAVLFVVGIQQAYAEEITVDVPFVPEEQEFPPCSFSYNSVREQMQYLCGWFMTPTAEEIIIISEGDPELIPENIVDAIIEKQIVKVTEPQKPQTPAERTIEKLIEKWIEEGELVSHEAQLLKSLQSLQKECELGTEQGAPIQTYELFTIATFEPYVHTDLGTQYLLKQIVLAIQECKSQQILKNKVLGDQYLHIPGQADVKALHEFRDNFEGLLWDELEGLDNPTYAFEERHMTAFNFEKSAQFAEAYKCSAIGKSMGFCRDPFTGLAPPEDVVTKSQEGKEILSKFRAYQETGVTEIPKQKQGEAFDPTSALDQYIQAYGITEEQLKEWFEGRQ